MCYRESQASGSVTDAEVMLHIVTADNMGKKLYRKSELIKFDQI